jgi:HK97 gp10 family phage protein
VANSSITNVTGLKELDAILKSLPAKVEGNVMRGALRAGQVVLLKAAQDALVSQGAVDSGALLKSLRIRQAVRSKKFGWVRMNLIAGNKEAWYSHMVEYGTASYYSGQGRTVGKPYKIKPKKGGALLFGGKVREEVTHPGIRPRPFMRRAVDGSSKAAIDATVAYIRRRLPKEVAKAGR